MQGAILQLTLEKEERRELLRIVDDKKTDEAELLAAIFRPHAFDASRAVKNLTKTQDDTPQEKESENGVVYFTDKEIKTMPKKIQRLIILEGKRCRLRTRQSGKDSTTYQIRFRRDGYDVNACGVTIELAKQNFLEKLKTAKPKAEQAGDAVPSTFSAFALYHFEKFQKEKVSKRHYENSVRLFNRYLAPRFRETPINKITPSDCKAILDEVKEQGKGKTADDLHSLMNGVFKNAIAHALIARNPLALVLHIQHEKENGEAIGKDDEKRLFDEFRRLGYGEEFERAAAFALFCGLRPNELLHEKHPPQVVGKFIKAVNSKRHNKDKTKIEFKIIPIIDRLRPFLPADGVLHAPNLDMLRRAIKKALPGHKLYDLRTTFYTRCDEYGVAPPARDEFVGHSSGVLTNTYRDLSDEYLLNEGEKLNKWV